jgi:hypothetical protein
MNSRQRLETTLNHKAPDRVCIDFGATPVTGIAATAVSRLREAIIGQRDYRVRVIEPYQILGEIDELLIDAMGIDVVGVSPAQTLFGFENKDWKDFDLFDGTKVRVQGGFVTKRDKNGDLLIFPQGDTSVEPTGRLPKGGFYFDAICRQGPIDEDKLNPLDNLEEFGILGESDLKYFSETAAKKAATGKGVILVVPGAGFGDIALVPAPWMKKVKGIRDVEEWYISTAARKDYVRKVFEGQCEIALKNLVLLFKAVGDNVQAAFITGTDFGTQRGLFISVKAYRELYKPFHKQVNDLIHKNTRWKTFIHSCGGIYELIPDFIEAGFDILNPVQCSAEGMEPKRLKKEFGKNLVFWGGGVDTQKTLAFGTADEVYREVRERIEVFNDGGGFVFDAIHNIQATTPVENILAMLRAIKDSK